MILNVPGKAEMSPSLSRRSVWGANWRFASGMATSLLTLGVTVVLARIIPPEDFGLLGMAMIITGFAEKFATLGMGGSVIKRRLLSEAHIRVSMTISTVLGMLITASLWYLAGSAAVFFDDPRVAPILRACAFIFLFSGFSSVSMGLLQRDLKFKALFYIELGSYVLGYALLAIPLAMNGYGYWALVVGTLGSQILMCIMSLWFAGPPVKPLFRRREFNDMIGFGSGKTAIGMTNYAASNVDFAVIGKYFSAFELGLYTRAFYMMSIPIQRIAFTMSAILFPVFSELQHDKEKIAEGYFKSINIASLFVFPIMVGMSVGAELVIIGVFGENWYGAVPVFRILCIAGLFKAVFHLAGPVAQATGHVFHEAKRQVIYFIVLLLSALAGVHYGIEGVGIAVMVGSICFYVMMARLTLTILNSSWKTFYMAQLPGLFIAGLVGATELVVICLLKYASFGESLKLVILISCSALVTGLSLVFLPRSVKGEIPAWLLEHYGRFLPSGPRYWLEKYV
jgi:PST family polysaccharide transporter